MYPALAVANYFIERSLATGMKLTPMQVIKLVYIAHGWHLAHIQTPLINEGVQAWKYGPVIPSLYKEFARYRDGTITSLGQDYSLYGLTSPHIGDGQTRYLLDSVWEAYKRFSGLELSTMTHKDGTPWSVTWRQNNGSSKRGAIIPNDLIQRHYEELKRERSGG